MDTGVKERSFFSAICVERCGGVCCDPWWGIISYPFARDGGLGNPSVFRAEVLKGIKARVGRITDAYKTSGEEPRRLFGQPERYNVVVRDIRRSGQAVTMNLVAMFAFRCSLLGDDKSCSIHPSIIGCEIRPPHCGELGSRDAGPGEKGFCRIIHEAGAAQGDQAAIDAAIEREKGISARSFNEGAETAEDAAERVVEAVRSWCGANAPDLLPDDRAAQQPGRNDPCWCGSGAKFKKCHGR
jgi:Fe-S-cluster containining protein